LQLAHGSLAHFYRYSIAVSLVQTGEQAGAYTWCLTPLPATSARTGLTPATSAPGLGRRGRLRSPLLDRALTRMRAMHAAAAPASCRTVAQW
jgi:hypothetical protein